MYSLFIIEQVAYLRGHTGLVKGVTWDPVGKYLASQVSTQYLQNMFKLKSGYSAICHSKGHLLIVSQNITRHNF